MIKVIIERIIEEGLEVPYQEAIRDTLKAVLDAPGYISSEALTDVKNPLHRLIITNWRSEQAWEKWYSSEARKDATAAISVILHSDEKITITETR